MPEDEKSTQITVCVPVSMAVALRDRARAKGPDVSRNDVVRAAFREYFARHPSPARNGVGAK